jgi:hypothetical protein
MVKMKEVCNEIDCGQKGRCFTTQVGLRDCSTDAILRYSDSQSRFKKFKRMDHPTLPQLP